MNELNGTDNHHNENEEQQAFVLRISLKGFGVMDALEANQIAIGWSRARGLRNENLSWEEFRQIVSDEYYGGEANMRKAGASAGHMWRFIREMKEGDLVVVPDAPNFHVAEVAGPATYGEANIENDSAHRRSVKWLNDGKPIPRNLARAALIARMNIRNTSAYATDLLPEIKDVLQISEEGVTPTFWGDLQNSLTKETLKNIRSGRMDNHRFERLILQVFTNLGAKNARIVARNQDQGADIVMTFNVARVINQTVAVQVKYHRKPEPPAGEDVVGQIIQGMESESASLGIIVTAGTVSEKARSRAENFFNESGIKIELVDGELLAKLIVEYGIKSN